MALPTRASAVSLSARPRLAPAREPVISNENSHSSACVFATRADEGSVPGLSVMIRLTEPDPYLLTKSEERSSQQTKSEQKKNAGSVFVLQVEKRARKSYNQEQRSADTAGQC